MASSWIERRRSSDGVRYRVRYRLGGRESVPRYGGSFATKREALVRKAWIAGELAAMRVPDLAALTEPDPGPTLNELAARWQASRVDVREATAVQHRVALRRVLVGLGNRRAAELTPAHVADLVAGLTENGYARESIRKTVTALAMVLDFGGLVPNPARDRIQVRLPRREPVEPEPPSARHVEAVAWLLPIPYLVGLLVLDSTGCRLGELEAARIGDVDENRSAWLVRAAVSKARQPRWVELPADLFSVIVDYPHARTATLVHNCSTA